MGKRLYSCITIAIMLVIAVAACEDGDSDDNSLPCNDALGCVTIAPGEPILLGSLQVLSGGAAPIGETQDQTIRLALQDRNNELLGHPIELHSEDTGCTAEGGANAALRIVAEQQMVGVIGTACSGAASGAAPIITGAGLVMISGANTAPALTSMGSEAGSEWHAGYFRTIYNGDALAQAAARFVREELGFDRVATVNDGDLFSSGVARSFELAFADLAGTITISMTINKGDEDMRPALAAIANTNPQLIFIPIFQPEADFLLAQARALPGLASVQFMAIESLLVDNFIRTLDPDAGVYFATATVFDTPAVSDLAGRYRAQVGQSPNTTFRYAYDAAGLLLYAIEQTAEQQADGTLQIGREALRDTLYAVQGYNGLTGTFSCDEYGDCSLATFYIVRVDDPAAGLEGALSQVIATYTSGTP